MKSACEIARAAALLDAALDLHVPNQILEQMLISLDVLHWVNGEEGTVLELNLRNLSQLVVEPPKETVQ
jgi:hypothetical protein